MVRQRSTSAQAGSAPFLAHAFKPSRQYPQDMRGDERDLLNMHFSPAECSGGTGDLVKKSLKFPALSLTSNV